jgi:hypothetical protein
VDVTAGRFCLCAFFPAVSNAPYRLHEIRNELRGIGHGENGKGSSLAPNLASGHWLWGDGSLGAIRKVVDEGVSQPKQFRSPMPPRGGSSLSDADIDAVAAYVWAISRTEKK